MMEASPEAIVLCRPTRQTGPLLAASPHSGRRYDADFTATVRLDAATLRRSEDTFMDELLADAPAHGVPLLKAEFPRAYCDVNREAWELDPAMFEDELPPWVNTTSPRVGAGLGTLARVVADGEAIYGVRLRFAEAERRVRTCWQPYHDALSGLLADTRAKFGAAVLLDCHSMPAAAIGEGRRLPDLVLGDAHGTSCAPAVTRFVEQFWTRRGYLVRRNDPYAGGYVTRHYGAPRAHMHVLQIEWARRLYMDERTLERTEGVARLRTDIAALLAALARESAALVLE